MKRTELRRGGPLRRRKPLRRSVSAYERSFRLARAQVLYEANGRCEVKYPHHCLGAPITAHHRKLRSQGGTNDLDNLLAVCRNAHDLIHRLPRATAVRAGLIIPRDQPVTPYLGETYDVP